MAADPGLRCRLQYTQLPARGAASLPPRLPHSLHGKQWPSEGKMGQGHYITVAIVLVVLHSTSPQTPQRNTASTKVFPNQLQCKSESGCTSGAPNQGRQTTNIECDETKPGYVEYTSCHVLRTRFHQHQETHAYHERILVDIRAGANLTAALANVTAALANVTRSQHEQVLTELETVRGRLAAAAVLSFTQLAIVVIYLIYLMIMFIKKRCENTRWNRETD